jgi:hypothetical protein
LVKRHLLEANMKFLLGLVIAITTVLAAQVGTAKTPLAGFPAATARPPEPLAIQDAVSKAADDLFGQVVKEGQTVEIVIDPLIDGITGAETAATRSIARRISEIAVTRHPQVKVLLFTRDNIQRAKFVFIGTFNAINNAGQPSGERDAFWICFALVDANAKVVVARVVGRTTLADIDSTPTPLFASSPVWALDDATLAYIRTCQRSRPGDAVPAEYVDSLEVRAALAEARAAFDHGRFDDAVAQFQHIAALPGGGQSIEALNGLYLTLMKSGRTQDAMTVFGRLIDAGFERQRLGVVFLFKARSTEFIDDAAVTGTYPAWLERIGDRTRAADVCLDIVGHASRTGSEPFNIRLTRARAASVRAGLLKSAPQLASRVAIIGVGSREALIGLPVDDAQTTLDRRVEFRPRACTKRNKATLHTDAAAGASAVADQLFAQSEWQGFVS